MTTKCLNRNSDYPELLIDLPDLPPPMKWVVHYREYYTVCPCDILAREGHTVRAICIEEYESNVFTVETWDGDSWVAHGKYDTASNAQHVAAALCWMGMT